MGKRKFRLLSIAIMILLAIPQNAMAAISNDTATTGSTATKGKTIYYSEKNGVRQNFTQDTQGKLIPGTTYSTQNTMSTNSKVTDTNTKSKLTTKNVKKGALKDQLIRKSKTSQVISKPSSTAKIQDKFSKDKLKKNPLVVPGELLVKFKDSTTQTAKNSLLNKNNLKSKSGVKPKNIVLVTLPKNANMDSMTKTLKSDPNVVSVQPNFKYYADTLPTEPLFNQLWGLENNGQSINGSAGVPGIDISVLDAWNITKGDSTVVVGVIDTGIDIKHPDLVDKIWSNPNEIAGDGIDNDGNGYVDDVNGWDFYNYDNTVFDWEDGDNHATHVSGTIAASINNVGVVGIAPNVKIMPLKFLGPQGGDTYGAILAIEYAKAKGVKILNNSWGGGGFDQMLRDTIANSGTIFIAAAGNDSIDNDLDPHYPSSYDCDNILSVAAINNIGDLSNFSNWGPTSVDVAAPGEEILSSVPKNAAFGAGILSSNTFFQGFGLEILSTDQDRKNFMQKTLSSLGIISTSKILIVQDDASDEPGYLNCLSSYQLALTALGYQPTVITVPSYTSGPSADVMNQYDLVIWFTGNDVVSLMAADQTNLMSFLDSGKKLFLSGRDAGFAIENTEFYQNYLHAYFIDENSTRTSISGEPNTAFSGDIYSLNQNIWLDYLKPADSEGQVVLKFTPDANYTNAYNYYSGTSMATPHVVGIAALLLSNQPNIDPLIIKQKIMKSVAILPSTSGMTVTGGLVDATKALSLPDMALDDDIPGVPIKETITGTLDQNTDLDDVYSVNLNAGETITLNLQGAPTENTDFDLHLYSPASTSVSNAAGILVSSEQPETSNETIKFTAVESGTYYVDVYAYAGVGSYTLSKSSELIYDDASPYLNYIGNWTTDINTGNEGGTAKLLNSYGKVSFSFTGSSIKWTGFKDPKQGIARVVIDGVTVAEVSLYAQSRGYKQLLFEKSLNFGKHVMSIQWTGLWDKHDRVRKTDTSINIDTIIINTSATKASAPTITNITGYASFIGLTFRNNDPSAAKLNIYKSTDGSNFTLLETYNSSYYPNQEFWIEDMDVLNNVIYSYYVTAVNTIGESVPSNTVSASKATTNSVYNLEDTNSNMIYTGTWNEESSPTYSGGTRHVTIETGAKVSIPFTALESAIKFMSGPDMGIARIYWPNSNGDYYEADLNSPYEGYWRFGTFSSMQMNGNWIIECVSGKINFDVEEIWDYTTMAPTASTNLTGALANNAVSLNWTANTELDIKGYNVYRSTTAGSGYSLLNAAPITNAQFTDNTVLPGQDSYYVVKAVNYANLESLASSEVKIAQAIAAPTGLTGTLSGTSAVLNWVQHPNTTVTQYKIYRSTTLGSNYQLLTTVLKPIVTYTDSTVFAGNTYYYAISAVSGTGVESVKSGQVSVAVPTSVVNTQRFEETNSSIVYTGTWILGATSSFSGGTVKNSNVTNSSSEFTFTGTGIRWLSYLTTNRGKADVFIDGNLISTVDTYSASTQAQKVAFEKLDLLSGSHKIKIVVAGTKNSASTDNYITIDAFDVVLLPETASAPTGLTGILSGTSALLNWTQHTDPTVTQYKIYRSTTSGSNYQLLSTVSKPVITYTDTTVSNGTTYYYVITAINGTGLDSPRSSQVSIVVPTSVGNIQRFEETNSNIVYTGTWILGSTSSFSGGTVKNSNITNSSSEFTFTGTGIKWLSYLTTNRGKADVYIDGNLISTVDTYSASAQAQKVAFEKLDLLSGSHKIKIVVAGTKNSASTDNYITVDAFDVLN